MGHKKSTATSKSSEPAKDESTAVTQKNDRSRRRSNVKIVQNVLLIWLDASIDEKNDANCRNTIIQFQRVVNNIHTFTNDDQCIKFVETIDSNNYKACMIISDFFAQQIVPYVHKMPQVDSIFILCDNKKYHEQWTQRWTKIKGVFTAITSICEAVKKAAQQCEHNATPISFLTTSDDDTKQKKLDQFDSSFMYVQILKDILLTTVFEQKHMQEFIDYCREQFADNEEELMNVKEIERNYYKKTPIWWYTRESFLQPMLNSALRLMDVDVMRKMGVFITDLHYQIDELHRQQFDDNNNSSTTFTVYRGQGICKEDLQQIIKTKGGLMAFNSFLSTSKLRPISLKLARDALSNPDLAGILFVMTIDLSQPTTPFASINETDSIKDEDGEVLFSMHSIFRIHGVKSIGENNRLYQVDLTLTNDKDKDLCALTDRIEEEMEGSNGWDRLGYLLLKINQSDKAEQVYNILVEQTTDQIESATYYHRLAWAKDDQGEYNEALALYEKSLAIREQLLPSDHPDLAKSYNNIGLMYSNMGEYSTALSYYEAALAIDQQSSSPNHLDLAKSHNNIGNVYSNMGEYTKALSSHEKALAIKKKLLPANHLDLASSYNNLGNVYSNMGEYSKALSCHEKALAIKQKSLSSNHPDLASSYTNIGNVYFNIGDYPRALSYYERDLQINQKSFPSTHPDLASSYNNIGLVYENMRDYSKALSSHEKALTIRQQSLSSLHPCLASSHNNIGNVYLNMGEYTEALSFHEEALAIRQQSLPPTHPDLAYSSLSIGLVHENMGDYVKARSFYEHAVEIAQQSLPANHPDLQVYSKNLDRVKNSK